MEIKQELPTMSFATPADWERWLDENHDTSQGIWLKMAKKRTGIPSITYQEAVEVALCYGWIDGQSKSVDDQYWIQRFTHRKPRSKWSAINCRRVEELIAAGKMKPPGLAEVEAARKDGRWENAYDSPSNIQVPADLQLRLESSPEALETFGRLDSRNRYAILYRLQNVKRQETRARKIEEFVRMLAEGKTIY